MPKNNLKSVAEFAKLCGVSHTIIRKRITQNEIKIVIISGTKFIDVSKNKIVKAKKGGRKSGKKIISDKKVINKTL